MLSICYDNEWSSSQKSFIDRLKLDQNTKQYSPSNIDLKSRQLAHSSHRQDGYYVPVNLMVLKNTKKLNYLLHHSYCEYFVMLCVCQYAIANKLFKFCPYLCQKWNTVFSSAYCNNKVKFLYKQHNIIQFFQREFSLIFFSNFFFQQQFKLSSHLCAILTMYLYIYRIYL